LYLGNADSKRNRRRVSDKNFSELERELRIKRIQNVIRHEEELNQLQMKHLQEKYAFDIRTAKANAELAELNLKQERKN